MVRYIAVLAATLLLSTVSTAQAPATPDPSVPTIQSSTQLVVVDVVVQDKDGHPIHGLKAEDFHITENKAPQNVRGFEEHSTLQPNAARPALPPLPPGTFTNYTPTPPNGTLNILLLDALNTPMSDQSYVRTQLQQYVKHADPGTRIAIFGLANRLILLQGFTSDPETLRDVVEHKLLPRASSLLDDPLGSGADQPSAANLVDTPPQNAAPQGAATSSTTLLAGNMAQFYAETAAMELQFRMQYTLDAFNTLAHYLAAFPGRKNLIWFSGSFPLNILPDHNLQDPFAIAQLDEREFRETTNLLTRAQVAVYPIDARGLMVHPIYSAANSARNFSGSPQNTAATLRRFEDDLAAEHATMQTMASDTGGRAYYNTNDLASAVSRAIEAGSNFYTLSYSPTNREQNGAYREVHVVLNGSQGPHNPQLTYRRGYYADDAKARRTTQAATSDTAHLDLAYSHAAMGRGAPPLQDLIFKARVLPASLQNEAAVAPNNSLKPSVTPGPYRRYDVDYVALARELTLTPQPDGRRSGGIEFLAYLFDVDGRLLNTASKTLSLNIKPESYDQFLHSAFQGHLEISVPTRTETYLRIGIRDITTNRFGVIELPASTVTRLPPPVYATPPSTPQPTSPVPSTTPPPPSTTPR